MTRRERLDRLEQDARRLDGAARQIEADAAEFDAIIRRLACNSLPEGVDQEQAWATARAILPSYPGCAAMFAGMTMTDLTL